MSSNKKNFFTHLELQGFKSFASKTVFDFSDNRSVGIVGPNGSGKSNIIDAIRWALGETGASRLRGDVLKNLIFAGTPKKSASGLAKVTLGFDNSTGVLPIDADEVNITRKIDRSGSSDFYINDQAVRLKDLEPLFAKAKLGSRGLMIIGQGQSDVFVKTSPQERREMIEEVLGLKEFRIKKKSAQRRLDKSKQNINTINAKIEEISPHLRFLKKQKKKWEQKSELQEKLHELSKDYFSHNYHRYQETIKETKEDLSRFRKKEEEQKKEISIIEKEIDDMSQTKPNKGQISEIREDINKIDRNRTDLERKLARLEAEKEFESRTKKEEINNLPSSSYFLGLIKDFVQEIKPAYQKNNSTNIIEVLGRWIGKFESTIPEDKGSDSEDTTEIDKKIKDFKEKINKLSEKIKSLREKEDSLLIGQEKENQVFREKVEELEDKKDALRKTDQNIQNLSLKKERTEYNIEELKNKWESIGFDLHKLHNMPKPDQDVAEDKNWREIEKQIDKLKGQLASIGDIDESLIEEADEMETRFHTLSEKKEDLEKASEDLEKLIKDLDKRIHNDFKKAFSHINSEFNNYFRLMFGGGRARMSMKIPEIDSESEEAELMDKEERERRAGVEISLNLPKKKITGMEMLSGGEKTLVSIAALFALVSVSPPPFLVLDEIDASLDDINAKRFADLIQEFSDQTQFVIVTHNRVTMEAVGALYGITMGDDGISTVLSIKLEEAEEIVTE